MDARQARAEIGVALVGGDGDHARIGDEEIRAADAHLGGEKGLAQPASRSGDEFGRVIGVNASQLFLEERGDFGARQVHRGRDDVVGRLVAKLNDEFSEVGLVDLHSFLFERGSQVNFLGDHGFRFHDGADAALARKIGDVRARFFGVLGPKYVASTRFHALLEFQEIAVEMVHRFPLYFLAPFPRGLPIEKARAAAFECFVVLVDAVPDDFAMREIGGLGGGVAQEFRGGVAHRAFPDAAD